MLPGEGLLLTECAGAGHAQKRLMGTTDLVLLWGAVIAVVFGAIIYVGRDGLNELRR